MVHVTQIRTLIEAVHVTQSHTLIEAVHVTQSPTLIEAVHVTQCRILIETVHVVHNCIQTAFGQPPIILSFSLVMTSDVIGICICIKQEHLKWYKSLFLSPHITDTTFTGLTRRVSYQKHVFHVQKCMYFDMTEYEATVPTSHRRTNNSFSYHNNIQICLGKTFLS